MLKENNSYLNAVLPSGHAERIFSSISFRLPVPCIIQLSAQYKLESFQEVLSPTNDFTLSFLSAGSSKYLRLSAMRCCILSTGMPWLISWQHPHVLAASPICFANFRLSVCSKEKSINGTWQSMGCSVNAGRSSSLSSSERGISSTPIFLSFSERSLIVGPRKTSGFEKIRLGTGLACTTRAMEGQSRRRSFECCSLSLKTAGSRVNVVE